MAQIKTPEKCPLGPVCPLAEEHDVLKEKVSTLFGEISVYKHDISTMDKYFDKMEKTVDKLANVIDDIHILVTVNTEKISKHTVEIATIEKDLEKHETLFEARRLERIQQIAETEKRLSEHFENIKKSIESMKSEVLKEIQSYKTNSDKRFKSLENWRYIIVGGMIVLSLIVPPILNRIINPSTTTHAFTSPPAITQPIK